MSDFLANLIQRAAGDTGGIRPRPISRYESMVAATAPGFVQETSNGAASPAPTLVPAAGQPWVDRTAALGAPSQAPEPGPVAQQKPPNSFMPPDSKAIAHPVSARVEPSVERLSTLLPRSALRSVAAAVSALPEPLQPGSIPATSELLDPVAKRRGEKFFEVPGRAASQPGPESGSDLSGAPRTAIQVNYASHSVIRTTPALPNSPQPIPARGLVQSSLPRKIEQAATRSNQLATAAPAPTIHVAIGRIEVRAVTPAPPASRKERSQPRIMSLDDYLRGGER